MLLSVQKHTPESHWHCKPPDEKISPIDDTEDRTGVGGPPVTRLEEQQNPGVGDILLVDYKNITPVLQYSPEKLVVATDAQRSKEEI